MARPTAAGTSPAAAPRPAADRPEELVAGLAGLAAAIDGATDSLRRCDLEALAASGERAEALTARLTAVTRALTDDERSRLDADRIRDLQGRIDRGIRRNAHLIARAWAIDAATMRLLASLAGSPADPPARAYVPLDGRAYLSRRA